MNKVQDIQCSDSALYQQFITKFADGEYAEAIAIITNNPQLNSKAFTASVINNAATSITGLENNYYTNVETFLANQFNSYQALINQYKNSQVWSATTTYQKYNFVYYNTDVYMYINNTATSGNLPTNTTYWAFIGLKGAQGAAGAGINLRYAWQPDTQYSALDFVTYQGSAWVAKQANINQIPVEGSTYWAFFVYMNKAEIYTSLTAPTSPYEGELWFEMQPI